jgi:hypothetical protein
MANSNALPLSIGKTPPEGPKAWSTVLDFTTVAQISMNLDLASIGLSFVQSVFVDNSNSNAPLTIVIPGVNQKIVVQAYAQAVFPVLQIGPTFQFAASSSGATPINLSFCNEMMDLMQWSTSNPNSIVGAVTVQGTITSVAAPSGMTDRSSVIVTGGLAVQPMASNGGRKRVIISNPSTILGQNIAAVESIFFNFFSAAGVNDAVSLELQPGQAWDSGGGACPTGLLSVNAATAGHRFIVKEMQ